MTNLTRNKPSGKASRNVTPHLGNTIDRLHHSVQTGMLLCTWTVDSSTDKHATGEVTVCKEQGIVGITFKWSLTAYATGIYFRAMLGEDKTPKYSYTLGSFITPNIASVDIALHSLGHTLLNEAKETKEPTVQEAPSSDDQAEGQGKALTLSVTGKQMKGDSKRNRAIQTAVKGLVLDAIKDVVRARGEDCPERSTLSFKDLASVFEAARITLTPKAMKYVTGFSFTGTVFDSNLDVTNFQAYVATDSNGDYEFRIDTTVVGG